MATAAVNTVAVNTDVVVVGAGPVGLLLAGELRLGGASVVVLEKRAAPTTESRASTLHARTMQLLASRGLVTVPGGYTWRTDARLTLPSPLRLTRAHARQFVQSVQCPTSLVLAQQGLMLLEPATRELLKDRPFKVHELPGQHHLHLDDEAGADAVAAIFRPFLQA